MMTPLDKQIKKDPQRIANAALQAFFNLSALWGLTTREEIILLGSPPQSTFDKWKMYKSDCKLNSDTLERISYLLGIYKDLNTLLPSKHSANEWLKKANTAPLFQGKSALEIILSGNINDLADVRRYLDMQKEKLELTANIRRKT